MARIKLFIIFLILCFPAVGLGAVIDCTDAPYSMVANGSTDWTTEFNACTAAAAGETELTAFLPAGDYYLISSDVTIPENVKVLGESGTQVNARMFLSDYSKIVGITFKAKARPVRTALNTKITGGWIQNNTFGISSSWPVVYLPLVHDFIIDGNTFNNAGGGSNIQVLGGKRNIVTNNILHGGKTCIIFKYYADANGDPGGVDANIQDNIVMGNSCDGFAEEGISFDLAATTSSLMFKENDFIDSVSSPDITLTHAGWGGGDDPNYIGFDMAFIDGALIGQTRVITDQTDATFTLDSAVTGAAPGDEVIIISTFKNNRIAYNNVNASGGYLDAAILLYGSSYQNFIFSNTLTNGGGIGLRSLDGLHESDTLGAGLGNVTSTCTKAPVSNNLVRDNVTDGWLKAYWRNYEGICGSVDPAYDSQGNSFVGNTNPDGVNIQYQNYYQTGNSNWSGTITNSTSLDIGDVSDQVDFSTPTCVNQGLGCFASIEIGAVTDLDDTCTGTQVCGAEGESWDISNALPADNAFGVNPEADLSWTNPTGTEATKVFFDSTDGTTAVNFTPWDTVTSYNPALEENTEYFWRVDIVHALDTETGVVRSFTTSGVPPPVAAASGLSFSKKGATLKFHPAGVSIKR